jgi:invasion protein IalB
MRKLRPTAAVLFATGVVAGMTGTALAQERTSATYDDWVLQCAADTAKPAQKTCDIEQVTQMQNQGRNVPLSRVAVARPEKGQPVMLTVQVPVNVSLRTGVIIKTSDSDPGLTAPFDRCLPVGCFADFALKDDAVRKFHSATTAGKLTFSVASGQNIAIPLSFKGFAPAFDALAKQ